MKLILKSILVWAGFIPIAILNGLARNYIYQSYFGELSSHQISSVIGSLVFILYVYLAFRKEISKLSIKGCLYLGLFWLFLTISFEFLFGHYVIGNSFEKLISDYNIFEGRIWILVLLSNSLSPLIIRKYSLSKLK